MARKKKKRKTFGDFILTLLMLAALCVCVYSGYTLYGYYREYKAGSDEYEALNDKYTVPEDPEERETEDYSTLENDDESQRVSGREVRTVHWDGRDYTLPVMHNPIDFDNLLKVNDELVGWLNVRAIDISYPILQAEDNEYYLHRTFEKQDNFAGCIFLNCDNEPDFSDMNSIVYGHNMKNGSMFGKIKNFSDPEVYNKSKYIWIYTPELIFQYRIFSVAVVNSTGITYQTFYQEDQFKELMDYAFSNSEVDGSDVEVTMDDKIVTLSTCTGDTSTRRVAFGKLIQMYASKEDYRMSDKVTERIQAKESERIAESERLAAESERAAAEALFYDENGNYIYGDSDFEDMQIEIQ